MSKETFYARAKAYILALPPNSRKKIASCCEEDRAELIQVCIDIITTHPRGWQFTFSQGKEYIVRRNCPAEMTFGQYCGYESRPTNF